MYRIHCVNNISKVGTDRFGEGYEFVDDAVDADAVIVRSANLHEVEMPKTLLAIARAGAGVNNIPLDLCAEQGTVVFNTPGANANAVKEMVLAGMLLASRDIIGGNEWVRDNLDDPDVGKKAEKAKKQFAGTELAGKTIGVIGLGAIGAMVANACRQLGMHVYGYDPYLSVNAAWSLDRHIRHANNLESLIAESDFVTIHVPATDETRGLIGTDEIAKMKDGAIVLNFARDVLVDEVAMADALRAGHIRCYVTDFANSISAQMPEAIVFPHLAASTKEAEDNCSIMAADELMDYLENGNIAHSVNFASVDHGPIKPGTSRLCVFHRNVPKMIGHFTSLLSQAELNIENMTNKSRGEYAYTLIETTGEIPEELIKRIGGMDDVMRARLIQA